MTRELLVEMVGKGVVTPTGLISQGRGEAFEYMMGERTTAPAEDAERAAAAMLLLAENPVVCINGNAAALDAEGLIALAKAVPAKIEVNLFHRTPERMEAVISHLESKGADVVLGRVPDERIPDLHGPDLRRDLPRHDEHPPFRGGAARRQGSNNKGL